MEGSTLKRCIASSQTLPELLVHEERCRSRLTGHVESMAQMQKRFHLEQAGHVKRLKHRSQPAPAQREDGRYDQHKQLGGCFQEVQHMDTALSAVERKKDQLKFIQRQKVLVKPIQASGCARSQSVTDMQKWFKAYGEPSGLTKWSDWRSSSPYVQSLRIRVSY